MTRARIIELKNEMEKLGWELINVNGNDLFTVCDEKINWSMVNGRTGRKNRLTFYLFDYLGRRTDKLSDILYVEDESNKKLYFDKIDSKGWKVNLREFVRNLY